MSVRPWNDTKTNTQTSTAKSSVRPWNTSADSVSSEPTKHSNMLYSDTEQGVPVQEPVQQEAIRQEIYQPEPFAAPYEPYEPVSSSTPSFIPPDDINNEARFGPKVYNRTIEQNRPANSQLNNFAIKTINDKYKANPNYSPTVNNQLEIERRQEIDLLNNALPVKSQAYDKNAPLLNPEATKSTLPYLGEKAKSGLSGSVEGMQDIYNIGNNPVVPKGRDLFKGEIDKDRQAFAQAEEENVKSKFVRTLGNATESVARMIPNIMLGAAGAPSAISLSLMGASAAGSARKEALSAGATETQANMYGLLTGGIEAATESIIGGVPFMKGFADKAVGKLTSPIKNNIARLIANRLLDGIGEGGEEIIAGFLEPYSKRATYDKTAKNKTASQLATDFAMGVLVSGIMQLPQTSLQLYDTIRSSADVNNKAVIAADTAMAMGDAYKSAKMLDKTSLSDMDSDKKIGLINQVKEDLGKFAEKFFNKMSKSDEKIVELSKTQTAKPANTYENFINAMKDTGKSTEGITEEEWFKTSTEFHEKMPTVYDAPIRAEKKAETSQQAMPEIIDNQVGEIKNPIEQKSEIKSIEVKQGEETGLNVKSIPAEEDKSSLIDKFFSTMKPRFSYSMENTDTKWDPLDPENTGSGLDRALYRDREINKWIAQLDDLVEKIWGKRTSSWSGGGKQKTSSELKSNPNFEKHVKEYFGVDASSFEFVEDLKAAYRNAAKKFHPDISNDPNATVNMKNINNLISDPYWSRLVKKPVVAKQEVVKKAENQAENKASIPSVEQGSTSIPVEEIRGVEGVKSVVDNASETKPIAEVKPVESPAQTEPQQVKSVADTNVGSKVVETKGEANKELERKIEKEVSNQAFEKAMARMGYKTLDDIDKKGKLVPKTIKVNGLLPSMYDRQRQQFDALVESYTKTLTGNKQLIKTVTDKYNADKEQNKFAQEVEDSFGKPDWQVPQKIILERGSRYVDGKDVLAKHKEAIQKALNDDKPVPKEVLADYPDLQKQTPVEQKAETKPVEVKQEEKEQPKLYRYYLTQRSPGPGTIPNGAVNTESFDTKQNVPGIGRQAWGYVEYSEPLSSTVIDDYELTDASMPKEEPIISAYEQKRNERNKEAEENKRLQKLGTDLTGVRLTDAKPTAMMYELFQKGEITQAEYDKYVDSLITGNQISDRSILGEQRIQEAFDRKNLSEKKVEPVKEVVKEETKVYEAKIDGVPGNFISATQKEAINALQKEIDDTQKKIDEREKEGSDSGRYKEQQKKLEEKLYKLTDEIRREYQSENNNWVVDKGTEDIIKKVKTPYEIQSLLENPPDKPLYPKVYFIMKPGVTKKFVEVSGTKVNFDGMDLFVHKSNDVWAVSEGKTGVRITLGGGKETRKSVIEKAIETINKFGVEGINKRIVEFLKSDSASPRYVGIKNTKYQTEMLETETTTEPVKNNTLAWLDTQADNARDRIKSRKGRLLSGLPMDDLVDYAIIGADKLANGVVDFSVWSKEMIKDFGEDLRLFLDAIYGQSKKILASEPKEVEEMISLVENIKLDKPKESDVAYAKIESDSAVLTIAEATNAPIDSVEEKLTEISKLKTNTLVKSPAFQEEEIANIVEEIDMTYGVKTNKRSIELGKYMADNDMLNTMDRITKNGLEGAEDTAAAYFISINLANEAKKSKDYSKLKSFLKTVQKSATKEGQIIQAFKIWQNEPDGMLRNAVKTVQDIEDATKKRNPKQIDQIDKETKDIADAIDKVDKEAAKEIVDDVNKKADEVLKKTREKKPSEGNKTSEGDKANKTDSKGKDNVEPKEEMKPEEMLAKKIENYAKDPTLTKDDPIKAMVNELFKVAKESPITREKVKAKTAMAFISEALNNRQQYVETWIKAKSIVSEKFKENDEAMAKLEAYFDKGIRPPFSSESFNKMIREGMAELNMNIGEMVKNYYATGSKQRRDLTNYLAEKAKISIDDAKTLAKYVDVRMKELTKAKRKQILESIFKEETVKKAKAGAIKSIEELSNIRAFANDNYKAKVMEKLTPRIQKLINEGFKGTPNKSGSLVEDTRIDFGELVKKSVSEIDFTRAKFLKTISEALQVNDFDAKTILNAISNRFDEIVQEKRATILGNMFKKREATVKKTGIQRVQEYIDKQVELDNLGAEQDAIRDFIKEKYGLPTLTNDDMAFITEGIDKLKALEKGTRPYNETLWRIFNRIESKVPSSFIDKFRAWQRISMLPNVKTFTRNILGNVFMEKMENFNELTTTALVDWIASSVTGKRTVLGPAAAIQKSIAQTKGKVTGLKDTLLDIKNKVNTYDVQGQYEINVSKNAFKNPVLNALEQFTNRTLQFGDRPFYEAAKARRIAELKIINTTDTVTDETESDAILYALDRTFQNDSELSGAVLKAKKLMKNPVYETIANIVVPFAKTPANILDKISDYTPIGLGKALSHLGKNYNTGKFDQLYFSQRLGRFLTGSGLLTLGYLLASLGLITGAPEKPGSKKAAFDKSAGKLSYALKTNDGYVAYDWIQPVGALLALGADAYKSGVDKTTFADKALSGLEGAGNTFFNMSMLKNLSSLLNYGNPVGGLINTILGSGQQFMPTSVKQAMKIGDKFERDTYDPDKLKAIANQYKANIPGLRQTLPIKTDAYGQPMIVQDGYGLAQKIYNIAANPATVTKSNMTGYEKEIERLYELNKNSAVLPSVLDKVIEYNNVDYELTNEQFTKYKNLYGEIAINGLKDKNGKTTLAGIKDIVNSAEYKKLPDNAKEKYIASLMSKVYELAKKVTIAEITKK